MDRSRYNPLNRQNLAWSEGDVYRVTISQEGPRGGKRPPLWDGYVRQYPRSFDAAVEDAWADLRSKTIEQVRCSG